MPYPKPNAPTEAQWQAAGEICAQVEERIEEWFTDLPSDIRKPDGTLDMFIVKRHPTARALAMLMANPLPAMQQAFGSSTVSVPDPRIAETRETLLALAEQLRG